MAPAPSYETLLLRFEHRGHTLTLLPLYRYCYGYTATTIATTTNVTITTIPAATAYISKIQFKHVWLCFELISSRGTCYSPGVFGACETRRDNPRGGQISVHPLGPLSYLL